MESNKKQINDKCACISHHISEITCKQHPKKNKKLKKCLRTLGLNRRSCISRRLRNSDDQNSKAQPLKDTKERSNWFNALIFCTRQGHSTMDKDDISVCSSKNNSTARTALPFSRDPEILAASSSKNFTENGGHIPGCGPSSELDLDQQTEARCIYEVAQTPCCNCLGSRDPWLSIDHEDCEEAARLERAREIEQGVEAPANFKSLWRVHLVCSDKSTEGEQLSRRLQLVCPSDLNVDTLRALFQRNVTLQSCPVDNVMGCHTQVDFIHCLVPDLLEITKCSFYWGKIDRYQAERLLDGKPEGTFLLRDSAQDDFLFSVSFRKYNRSLHARIEQWNHKFSFDSHDPGVCTSDTVCGLIERYKDPSSCMFFEPMLTWPLHRNFTFSLQHLCRAIIVNHLTYDNINHLQLPKTLKNFLKEYHYKQKVRVERFDDEVQLLDLRYTTGP